MPALQKGVVASGTEVAGGKMLIRGGACRFPVRGEGVCEVAGRRGCNAPKRDPAAQPAMMGFKSDSPMAMYEVA